MTTQPAYIRSPAPIADVAGRKGGVRIMTL